MHRSFAGPMLALLLQACGGGAEPTEPTTDADTDADTDSEELPDPIAEYTGPSTLVWVRGSSEQTFEIAFGDPDEGPATRWVASLDLGEDAPAAIRCSGDAVYVITTGRLLRVDPATGAVDWTANLAGVVPDVVELDGRVWYGATGSPSLLALDAATGVANLEQASTRLGAGEVLLGLVPLADGFAAIWSSGVVESRDPSGGPTGEVSVGSPLGGTLRSAVFQAGPIVAASAGNTVWLVDQRLSIDAGQVFEVDLDAGTSAFLGKTGANPIRGSDVGPSGTAVWVYEGMDSSSTAQQRRIGRDGFDERVSLSTSVPGETIGAGFLAVEADGDFWTELIREGEGNRIARFDPVTGEIVESWADPEDSSVPYSDRSTVLLTSCKSPDPG